jgi:hypothetical protein
MNLKEKRRVIGLIDQHIENLQSVILRVESKSSKEHWQKEIAECLKIKNKLSPADLIENKEAWNDFLLGTLVGMLAGFAIHHIITNFI